MKVFLILSLILTAIVTNKCQAEYYQELITNEIDRISNFTLKTNNSEFWENNIDNKTHDFGKYDFIIVGAGTAGAIVANRLSEKHKWKILVLEAGENENDFTDIPGMWMWSVTSDRSWNYRTTPQTTYCLGMNNRQCYFPVGKSVGETSIISLVQSRGNRRDFDRWALVHGNRGWSYQQVLPYFKKFENFDVEGEGDSDYHGYSGPITVSHVKPEHNLTRIFIKANQEIGLDLIDNNGAKQIGVSIDQKYLKNGKRISSGRGYIDPIKNRKNFKISTKSYVTKVLIDKFKRANGVVFIKNGKKYRAIARKEVILSAGAINSAQLLMLSGIGPKEHLRKLSIKVIKNLPVGQYLYDHISYMLDFDSSFVIQSPNIGRTN